MLQIPSRFDRFKRQRRLCVLRAAAIVWKTVPQLCVAVMMFSLGCESKSPPSPVVEKVSVVSSSGTLLTFTAQLKGTVAKRADHTTVTTGRKFHIDGELTTQCKVGDLVHLDLRHRVGPNEWSTLANAVTKVESVRDGKGRFSTEFFITDIGDREGSMNVELYAPAADKRTDAGAVDIELRSGR